MIYSKSTNFLKGDVKLGFAKFSSDFLMESFTLVDNLFISEHLPFVSDTQCKIYLYGLYLCSVPENVNSLETMAQVLNVGIDEIISAYTYFEDSGLVQILSKQPLEVKYLSLKKAQQPPKKYKAEKWNDFNLQLQQLYPDRMLTPNEFNEYYNFFDSYKMDTDAMLMVVQYCINLKGLSIRYPYILTVAKNWVQDGVKTIADVEEKLNEYDAQTESMRQVLSALNRKTGAELEEKQMLQKWLGSWGYELPAILKAAKLLKGGKSFIKLDKKLDEFYRMNIFTAEEMSDYQNHREKLYNLAININKNLGVYYESLDHIIEVYTIPWTTKGFSDDALLTIAHHCFISGIKSLEGLNSVVQRFYSEGLLSRESIDEFISSKIKLDEKIKAIIAKTGRSKSVTNSDREFYKTWTTIWGFNDEIILYAASLAVGKTYPATYINQLLSAWKSKHIDTLENAQKEAKGTQTTQNSALNFPQREYSDKELQSVITSIEQMKKIEW